MEGSQKSGKESVVKEKEYSTGPHAAGTSKETKAKDALLYLAMWQ